MNFTRPCYRWGSRVQMPTVDLGSAVVAAWLVMLGAGALNFALFALSRRRTRIRTVDLVSPWL
jgi:hypothetical protein